MPACLSSLPRAATGGYCCKSLFGWRTKIPRAADAHYAPRREGPYRFIQNRSRISVVALKSDAAAEKPKDQLSRDFLGCSIFDFCNNIGAKRSFGSPQGLAAATRLRRARFAVVGLPGHRRWRSGGPALPIDLTRAHDFGFEVSPRSDRRPEIAIALGDFDQARRHLALVKVRQPSDYGL